jgi:alginate O-acetyltransferase complex protein AlgI
LHGTYLAAERWLKEHKVYGLVPNNVVSKLLVALVTYSLVNVTWVFFRAKTFASAMSMLAAMAGMHGGAAAVLPTVKIVETVVCIIGLLLAQWHMRDKTLENVVMDSPVALVAGAWACMTFAIIIAQGTGDAFIYFQF